MFDFNSNSQMIINQRVTHSFYCLISCCLLSSCFNSIDKDLRNQAQDNSLIVVSNINSENWFSFFNSEFFDEKGVVDVQRTIFEYCENKNIKGKLDDYLFIRNVAGADDVLFMYDFECSRGKLRLTFRYVLSKSEYKLVGMKLDEVR